MMKFGSISLPLGFLLVFALGCGAGGDAPEATDQAGVQVGQAAEDLADGPISQSGNRIEFEVTGQLEASGAEDDVMICGTTEEPTWEARSLGEWVISFEIPTPNPGEHEILLVVAAPQGLIEHEAVNRDPRFRGTGTMTLKDAGTDAMGMKAVEAEFSGTELINQYEQVVHVTGKFSCSIL